MHPRLLRNGAVPRLSPRSLEVPANERILGYEASSRWGSRGTNGEQFLYRPHDCPSPGSVRFRDEFGLAGQMIQIRSEGERPLSDARAGLRMWAETRSAPPAGGGVTQVSRV